MENQAVSFRFSDDVPCARLIQFARLYAHLGSAVTEQLDSLLDGEYEDDPRKINPNAVDLIERHLGKQHSEIAEAIEAYRSWTQSRESGTKTVEAKS